MRIIQYNSWTSIHKKPPQENEFVGFFINSKEKECYILDCCFIYGKLRIISHTIDCPNFYKEEIPPEDFTLIAWKIKQEVLPIIKWED